MIRRLSFLRAAETSYHRSPRGDKKKPRLAQPAEVEQLLSTYLPIKASLFYPFGSTRWVGYRAKKLKFFPYRRDLGVVGWQSAKYIRGFTSAREEEVLYGDGENFASGIETYAFFVD